MAKELLTDTECSQADALVDTIIGYKSKIESCVSTFRYVLTDSRISKWVNDTTDGAVIYKAVMENNEALLQMAVQIHLICQHTDQLIYRSRRANATTTTDESGLAEIN